jgi:hypothetical protein
LLAAGATVEPPPGFADRVLHRLGPRSRPNRSPRSSVNS